LLLRAGETAEPRIAHVHEIGTRTAAMERVEAGQ